MNQEKVLEDEVEIVEENSANDCRDLQRTAEEAEIKEETAIVKPEFNEKLDAKVVGIAKIENNIEKAKEYAIELKKYYESVEITEETQKSAEDERAQINKQKKLVADFRKNIVAEFNKPIENFETMAKETEKILGETADFITTKTKIFDEKKKEFARKKIDNFFKEYSLSQNIDFINLDQVGVSIGINALTEKEKITKKIQDQITEFVDKVRKDLDLIDTLEFKEEILVEYKKTLLCADSIAVVQDRHKQLEEMKKKEEETKEQEITDESMLNRIDEVLSAPTITVASDEPTMIETAFVIRVDDIECLKEIKKICENYNAQLISLTKEEGVYHE